MTRLLAFDAVLVELRVGVVALLEVFQVVCLDLVPPPDGVRVDHLASDVDVPCFLRLGGGVGAEQANLGRHIVSCPFHVLYIGCGSFWTADNGFPYTCACSTTPTAELFSNTFMPLSRGRRSRRCTCSRRGKLKLPFPLREPPQNKRLGCPCVTGPRFCGYSMLFLHPGSVV